MTAPAQGHGKSDPDEYNIWWQNCHTAANSFVAAAADRSHVGILTCGGNPAMNLAHHTANWIVLADGRSCVYNWGKACCWKRQKTPIESDSPEAARCIQDACGRQYSSETRVMDSGKTAERPTPLTCLWIASGGMPDMATPHKPDFSARNKPICIRCCDLRANKWTWSSNLGDEKTFDFNKSVFRYQCKGYCEDLLTK